MELKKVIKEYQLKNDLFSLNRDELVDKFSFDKEAASDFLKTFYELLNSQPTFSVLIYDRNDDIKNVINTIFDKYPNEKEFLNLSREIVCSLDFETKVSHNSSDRRKTYEYYSAQQADRDGVLVINFGASAPGLNKILLDESLKLYECYKTNSMLPFKEEYEATIVEAENKGRFDSFGELYEKHKLKARYPLLKLCHEKEFLFLANDLLFSSSFEDKQELIDLTLDVIDFSTAYYPLEKTCNYKEYNRVARKTIKNIKGYNKENKLSNNHKMLRRIIL